MGGKNLEIDLEQAICSFKVNVIKEYFTFLKEGQFDQAILMIDEGGIDVDLSDKNGICALHYMASKGDLNYTQILLERGANINIRSNMGDTPLIIALGNSFFEVANLLIDAGADVKISNSQDYYPLYLAILKNANFNLLEKIIDKGAEIDSFNSCLNTPLFVAIESCNLQAVNLLIKAGANVNHINDQGRSSLHIVLYYLFKKNQDKILNINEEDYNNTSLQIVKILVENGANVNFADAGGLTPLNAALSGGHLLMAEWLVNNAKVDPNIYGHDNSVPLIIALNNNFSDLALNMISNGANINVLNAYNQTPLFYAAKLGNYNITNKLLQLGAKIDHKDIFDTNALSFAIENGNKEVINLLIRYGADVNAYSNQNNVNPLLLAITQGREELVDIFLENGANVNSLNKQKISPLHEAARIGINNIVEKLIKYGANIYVQDIEGSYPSHYAIISNNYVASKIIIDESLNCDEFAICQAIIDNCNSRGNSLLHLAINNINKIIRPVQEAGICNYSTLDSGKKAEVAHILDIVDLLLSYNADVNIANNDGLTILHIAAQTGEKDLVVKLIEKGAIVNAQNSLGETPLFYAVLAQDYSMVDLLLENGADANMDNIYGRTPLMESCSRGIKFVEVNYNSSSKIIYKIDYLDNEECKVNNYKIVKSLLDAGAEINAVSDMGISALRLAVQGGKEEIYNILLEKGARIDLGDKNNINVLHVAAYIGDKKAMSYLLKKLQDLKEYPFHSVSYYLDLVDNNNYTPLTISYCRDYGNNLFEMLLENGASSTSFAHLSMMNYYSYEFSLGAIECDLNYNFNDLIILGGGYSVYLA